MDGADWNLYIVNDLGAPATIVVDSQYRSAVAPPFPTLVILEVRLTHPRENGLPQADESKLIYAIEDRMDDVLRTSGKNRYVGHKLSNGSAEFFFYTSAADNLLASVTGVAAQFPDHFFETRAISDANWSVYRQSLLPAGDNIVQAADNKVISNLISYGDDGTRARTIDHFAYFSTAKGLNGFEAAILKDGFEVGDEASAVDSDGRWSIRFNRIDVPGEITPVTIKLAHLAVHFDGDYDGWECGVLPSTTLSVKQ
jgi:regulator of RNase E activity RraB